MLPRPGAPSFTICCSASSTSLGITSGKLKLMCDFLRRGSLGGRRLIAFRSAVMGMSFLAPRLIAASPGSISSFWNVEFLPLFDGFFDYLCFFSGTSSRCFLGISFLLLMLRFFFVFVGDLSSLRIFTRFPASKSSDVLLAAFSLLSSWQRCVFTSQSEQRPSWLDFTKVTSKTET